MDLVNLPLSISYPGRITSLTIDGQKWDRSKTYTVVSCYPHGNAVDEACRTSGAFNFRFMTGTPNADGEIGSPWGSAPPVNDENITDPGRTPVVIQAAPDNFVHPVDILREYLPGRVIDGITYGALGRVNSLGGHPVSECDPTLVQPIQGAGPGWLARDEDIPCRPQDN
jgi:sulfur-oxidizing protein SoxB